MKKLMITGLLAIIFCLPLFAQPGEIFIPDKADVVVMNDSITELVKSTPEIKLKELDVFTKSLTVFQDKLVKAEKKPINVTPEINQVLTSYKSLNKVIKANPDIVKEHPELMRYFHNVDEFLEWAMEHCLWTLMQLDFSFDGW